LAVKIYWTGSTKSGCAGQHSDCFAEKVSFPVKQVPVEILTNKEGGACVAFSRSAEGYVAKTMFCKSKAYLICKGKVCMGRVLD